MLPALLSAPVILTLLPPLLMVGVLSSRIAPPPPLAAVGGRNSGPLVALALIALIPFNLVLLASGSSAQQILALSLTGVAALWGALLLAGRRGVLVTAAAVGAATLGFGGIPVLDVLALLAALAGGELAYRAFGRGRLLPFLALLALVDCLIVRAGLTQAAFAGSFASLPGVPSGFAGVIVGDHFLGGIDLACSVLVALEVKRREPRLTVRALVASIYLVGQAVIVDLAEATSTAMPATLPALAALLALVICVRRRTRT